MGKALILVVLLAGCASIPQTVADPRKQWCEDNQPRRDATETTPRWELDEINAHNAKGVRWCQWQP